MNSLRNKYLTYNNIEIDGLLIKNSTEMILLPEIPDKYFTEQYIQTIQVPDNKLLESLSFDLYGTTNYWDLLLVLNDMKGFGEMPTVYDIVEKRAETKYNEWLKISKLVHSKITEDQKENKYNAILEDEIELNEKHRYMKYISTSSLSELETDLIDLGSKSNVNQNIIQGI